MKNNKFHTSKDYHVYLSLDNKDFKKAIFGPKYSTRWFGQGYSYSNEKIPESSICVKYGYLTAFGTNKDTVIEYIKKGINDSINHTNEQIISLESKISNMKKSLENIVFY